ncbi:MAG: dienelactone hydrolase family protein [Candidatus Rokubacteria bacterium]|nr:dienelactone hydrolase family protein [Candidatus Rokubacteria bacterium]MBI3826006.1 dienelactone hydrolase family protein [Candidatus Rokubacteria bacterium]
MERFEDAGRGAPAVRGVLHRPAAAPSAAIVLTHGAGGSAEAPLLVALCEALAAAGLLALRCDLPFRQERASGPPSPATAARDREGLARAAATARRLAPGPVFLGGHSYGGRQVSVLAAAEPTVADALLLLSYPLHPPRRPAEHRTTHFRDLRVPALFVHGSRDPFGSVAAMRLALKLIPARTSLLAVEGGTHDLRAGRGASGTPSVAIEIATAFKKFVDANG